MANITITNNDLGNVILKDAEFTDDRLRFDAAGTIVEGTILARDQLAQWFVPYVKGGSIPGDGSPRAVLTYDVTSDAPGEIPIRGLISGLVRQEKLIIDADGNDSNIDAFVLDELRDFSIVPVSVDELNILDNQ